MRPKILIAVVCVLLITVLTPVLYYYYSYVPYALGKQYVSVSFRPEGYSYGPGTGNKEVVFDGSLVRIDWMAIQINITNNYFVPVHIKYNGFDVVWLVYNRTVSDPSDVANNRDFLVWGAYNLLWSSYPGYKYADDFTGDGYEFYASRRELSNFTKTIKGWYSHVRNYPLFANPNISPGSWGGQYWFDAYSHVPPGTYYMYCIIFGITSGPHNVTIASISW